MSRHSCASLRVFLILAALTLGLSQAGSAAIYYVSATGTGNGSSWAAASNDLQGTINAASAGDQVWVKAGTYVGNFAANDGVAVHGGFAGTETSVGQRDIDAYPSVLNASGGNNNNGIGYYLSASLTRTNTLDGFTIENAIGGGLSDGGDDTLIVADCTFLNNSTTGNGGAVYVTDNATTINNCVFMNNMGANGGGCFFDAGTTVTLTGCMFSKNTASASGGGAFANFGTSTISDCTFVGNKATNTTVQFGGGGLCADGGTATVADCTFTSNIAAYDGGGLFALNGVCDINHSTFMNNTGIDGGGINAFSDTTTFNTCTFTGNAASNHGGGVLTNGNSTVAEQCLFVGNSGQGMYAIGAATVADCTFEKNTSDGLGLEQSGTASVASLVKDNLVMGTGTSASDANGIEIDAGNSGATTYVSISNNTIVDTNVGIKSGTSDGSIAIANNIFYDNFGGLDDVGSVAFTTLHNDFYANSSYNENGVTASASDLFGNPSFLAASIGNYRLAAGSPLLDAGDDSYVSSGDTDLDGNPRIQGSHVDIGAYEGAHTPIWTATAVGAGLGGTGRTLWDRSDGAAGLWALNGSDVQSAVGTTYGPYAGWTAKALATSNDGTSRVLWTNVDGRAGVWTFNAAGVETVIGATYGPYTGWTAQAVGVASDGTSRVLWTNTNGEAGVWSFGTDDAETVIGPTYGPVLNWTATSLATAMDGTSRVLWTNVDGTAGVWSFDTGNTATVIGATYGPFSGWTAQSVGASGDGTSRVLWTNTDGRAGVWSFNANDAEMLIGPTYGPYTGWTAGVLATASDGSSRVLWNNSDQSAGVWSFAPDDAESVIGTVYGPY